jgi:hypothetical protein
MDDEKLIECVRKYPAIYDMSHPKYLNNNYKPSLWKKILEMKKRYVEFHNFIYFVSQYTDHKL